MQSLLFPFYSPVFLPVVDFLWLWNTALFQSLSRCACFILQGRAALWDSILLFCYKIKTTYGSFARGIHLGSSALNILAVLESEEED